MKITSRKADASRWVFKTHVTDSAPIIFSSDAEAITIAFFMDGRAFRMEISHEQARHLAENLAWGMAFSPDQGPFEKRLQETQSALDRLEDVIDAFQDEADGLMEKIIFLSAPIEKEKS